MNAACIFLGADGFHLNIITNMKKIVFVEKEEGSYDPVVNFFNKKNTNPNKTSHPSTQNTNSTFKPPMNKKPASVMKPSTF